MRRLSLNGRNMETRGRPWDVHRLHTQDTRALRKEEQVARAKTSSDIYQIKVTLEESKPPIWRRFQVSGDTRLSELHEILQVVMGWANYHLYQFVIGGTYFGQPDPDFGFEMKSDRKVKLSQVIPGEKAKFAYEYDFGDSWGHQLLVEKILPPEPGVPYPVCLKGKRACPPEDCGGIWGYAEFLEAIQDPNHPEHDDMLEWVGGSFDPEAFNLDEVNRALRRIR